MKYLLLFVVYMVLFFGIYKIFFWFKSKKDLNRLYNIMEISFLEHYFKVEVRKINLRYLLNVIALSNAFIFTVVLLSTILIENVIIRLLVIFVLLLPIIYLVYYVIAVLLKKRGRKKNV